MAQHRARNWLVATAAVLVFVAAMVAGLVRRHPQPTSRVVLLLCQIGNLRNNGTVAPPTPGFEKLIVHGTITNLSHTQTSYAVTVVAYDGPFEVGTLDEPARAFSVRPGETSDFGAVGNVDHTHTLPQFPTCKVSVTAD